MRVITTATQISQAFKNAGRVSEILTVLAKHGFADLVHRMHLSRFLSKTSQQKKTTHFQELPTATRLRKSFEELGPTFIKLGQVLASRPDLIPAEFVNEFEQLQDQVSSVPFSQIRNLLETEWKKPLEEVLLSWEETPLAAASIAQVYGAVLKTGEKVALKIQRPGIKKLIQNDISILRGVAVLLEKYIPESHIINPTGLVEEFFRSIYFETDFRIEANNIRKIKKNLEHFPKIAIPKVFSELCSESILVLERIEGIRFSNREAVVAAGIDPVKILEMGAEVFFHMVMVDGLFHADPHAGNLFILSDGRIGFIDFGIVGRVAKKSQDSIITMFLSIIEEDFETLAYEYTNLCTSIGNTDLTGLHKDLMDAISPYLGMPMGEVNIGRVLLQSTSIAVKHHLQIPRELMLLFKAIFTIEALGKKLEPNFDLLQVGMQLAKKIVLHRYSIERIQSDLIVLLRDMKSLGEITPRLFRRFFRVWSQRDFSFSHRNKDIEELATSVRLLSYSFGMYLLSITCFGMGILFLHRKEEGEVLFGLPLFSFLFFMTGFIILILFLWKLQKRVYTNR